jgi:hypothetical protein
VILSDWIANVDMAARSAEGRHGSGARDYCTTPGKVEPNCFWTNLARCASAASMIENWSTPANAKILRLRVHESPHSMSWISSHAVRAHYGARAKPNQSPWILVASFPDLSAMLRRTSGEQITVETVLGGGLWRANLDPNQLEVAIINLAVNARDAPCQKGES